MLNSSGKTASAASARWASASRASARSTLAATCQGSEGICTAATVIFKGPSIRRRVRVCRRPAIRRTLRAGPWKARTVDGPAGEGRSDRDRPATACFDRRPGHALGQQERGEAAMDVPGPSRRIRHGRIAIADPTGRSVQDVPFHAGDADIIDEPSPGTVATAVDQDQSPPGLQDTVHLLDGALLVRIVMEAVGARDHIEGALGEGEPLAVTLDRYDMPAMRLPARASLWPASPRPGPHPRPSRAATTSRMRAAKTPVPHPTSRIVNGRSSNPARIRAMIARCAGRNRSHWRMLRS